MKYFFVLKLCLVVLGFALVTAHSQGEGDEFGYHVVVIQGEKPEEPDSNWSFWYPDEFADYLSSWFGKAPAFTIPGWAGGGSGGAGSPDCSAAQATLDDLRDQIWRNEIALEDMLSGLQPIRIYDRESDREINATNGSPAWVREIMRAISFLDYLKNEREKAKDAVKDACG